MENSTQRFLVIRLSSIGDIVHALPAVAALGESFPRGEIHWLIESRYAGLVEGNPFVHRVLKLDTLQWRRSPLSASTLEQIARAGSRLREGGFDTAVDFQGLIKSALLGRFSRAGERVGFSEPWLREPSAALFYTQRVSPRSAEGGHVIEWNMALVERLGARVPPLKGWRFPLPRSDEDDRYVEEQLAARQAQDCVVVNPGGGWKGKRWPPESFAELVRRLEQALPWKILLTGSPDEEPAIEEILARSRAGRAHYFPASLRQFIALARRARLFIGGDTGPMHLAAAAGTPVVALFNAAEPRNTPQRNGPFSPQDITLTNRHTEWAERRNKHGEYLQGISVDAVLEAVRERLARAYE
jgi:lipopolysaccharide heptosyltransferase I